MLITNEVLPHTSALKFFSSGCHFQENMWLSACGGVSAGLNPNHKVKYLQTMKVFGDLNRRPCCASDFILTWMNEWMNEGNAWSRWPLNISSYLIFWISSEWAWRQPCIHTPALNGLPIPSSALCRLSLSAASNQLWNVSLQVSLHKHKTPN